ncbi:hypothetical protein [Conexibacter sp. SYSU D00693]|uniref:hypothetical protein n=1 Tax=Conexibacter sp. SYSU D00693 TaxID=2812560 RepID=UPI00196B226D|nr:hypothetical protein [Conexibacter sp. SYSU D00693]
MAVRPPRELLATLAAGSGVSVVLAGTVLLGPGLLQVDPGTRGGPVVATGPAILLPEDPRREGRTGGTVFVPGGGSATGAPTPPSGGGDRAAERDEAQGDTTGSAGRGDGTPAPRSVQVVGRVTTEGLQPALAPLPGESTFTPGGPRTGAGDSPTGQPATAAARRVSLELQDLSLTPAATAGGRGQLRLRYAVHEARTADPASAGGAPAPAPVLPEAVEVRLDVPEVPAGTAMRVAVDLVHAGDDLRASQPNLRVLVSFVDALSDAAAMSETAPASDVASNRLDVVVPLDHPSTGVPARTDAPPAGSTAGAPVEVRVPVGEEEQGTPPEQTVDVPRGNAGGEELVPVVVDVDTGAVDQLPPPEGAPATGDAAPTEPPAAGEQAGPPAQAGRPADEQPAPPAEERPEPETTPEPPAATTPEPPADDDAEGAAEGTIDRPEATPDQPAAPAPGEGTAAGPSATATPEQRAAARKALVGLAWIAAARRAAQR